MILWDSGRLQEGSRTWRERRSCACGGAQGSVLQGKDQMSVGVWWLASTLHAVASNQAGPGGMYQRWRGELNACPRAFPG